MSVWEEIVGAFSKSDGSGGTEADWGKLLGLGGGVLAASGALGGKGSRPTGYQGKIPEYEYVREQYQYDDSNRRPGEGGRRYFSDGEFKEKTPTALAEGGIASLREGRYLDGSTDGMADEIPATIDGKDPALLSDGEFVIPADVVSHLGNGNSEAGAQVLYNMLDRIREARTGSKEQGKQINPNKMLPK